MSGGVDSAVAAYLLLQAWYEVIAGFMKNYADESNPTCHTKEDRDTAIQVAQFLWISTVIIFDFRKEYDERIIQYIYNWYKSWYTPNPDVLCNSQVKFDIFLEAAIKLWCDAIATGHYARIRQDEAGLFHLLKGVDTNKDQSYFLSWLNQYQLSKSIFPLGEMTKPQVRALAATIQLPNATRKDSQGLCFIGKVPMKTFLQKHLPLQPGVIKDTAWKQLGQHDGYYFYTIWQREGLGLAWWPRYVVSKDIAANEIIVGRKEEIALYNNRLTATQRHRVWAAYPLPLTAMSKIRYRQEDQVVTILPHTDAIVEVVFEVPQRAISAGQTIAIYEGDDLIASGIIQ